MSVAVDPMNSQTLYAATRSGVSKSTDGGASWGMSLGGLFTFTIAIDPSNPSNVYAGARVADGSGVSRSTNGGVTWSFVRLPFNGPNSTVNALAEWDWNSNIAAHLAQGAGSASRNNPGFEED